MSVRKRTWKTAKGEEKEAWIVDYFDQGRKRRLKTFAKKKDATAFEATANVEIRAGVHTADSASITIAEAGKKWIETSEFGAPEREPLERATVDAYRQHLRLHIEPYIGSVKLSQLSAPMVREFLDKLARGDMPGAPIDSALDRDGSQGQSFIVRPSSRRSRARSRRAQRR